MEFKEALQDIENLLKQKEQLIQQRVALDKKIYGVDVNINNIRKRDHQDTQRKDQSRAREVVRNATPDTPAPGAPVR